MENSQPIHSRLEGLTNSTPLKIDVFSVKEFDTSTPLPAQRQEKRDYLGIGLRLFAVLFAALVGIVFFNFSNAKVLKFVKDMILMTPEVKTSVRKLGGSVENYYNFLLGKTPSSSKLLLRLDIDNFVSDLQGVVAGAKTERRAVLSLGYQPIVYFKDLENSLRSKENVNGEENVLGENVFFKTEVERLLREGKELSAKILDNSKAAGTRLSEYEKFLQERNPKVDKQEFKLLYNRAKEANEKARNFISQAEKTGNYYYIIYDINIELTPQLLNYIEVLKKISVSSDPTLYLSQLDDFQYNLLKLSSKLKRVSSKDLPFGLEDLHNDNLRVFELLESNVKEVKSAVAQGRREEVLSSLQRLNMALSPIYERSKTLEINFWQNNRALRRYKEVVEKYGELEQDLQEYVLKNQNFLLELLSQLIS